MKTKFPNLPCSRCGYMANSWPIGWGWKMCVQIPRSIFRERAACPSSLRSCLPTCPYSQLSGTMGMAATLSRAAHQNLMLWNCTPAWNHLLQAVCTRENNVPTLFKIVMWGPYYWLNWKDIFSWTLHSNREYITYQKIFWQMCGISHKGTHTVLWESIQEGKLIWCEGPKKPLKEVHLSRNLKNEEEELAG